MEITEEQYARIKDSLAVQRGKREFIQPAVCDRSVARCRARMQVARASGRFADWHTIYTVCMRIETFSLDCGLRVPIRWCLSIP
jgi:hypothetical protein